MRISGRAITMRATKDKAERSAELQAESLAFLGGALFGEKSAPAKVKGVKSRLFESGERVKVIKGGYTEPFTKLSNAAH